MAKFLCSLTIFIVTVSVLESAQIFRFISTNIFDQSTKNDAKNDRRMDKDTRRIAQDELKAITTVKETLKSIEELINKNKHTQESFRISQIHKPDQKLHIYNPNIFFPEVIGALENNTSAYSDVPMQTPTSVVNDMKHNSISSIFQKLSQTQNLENVDETDTEPITALEELLRYQGTAPKYELVQIKESYQPLFWYKVLAKDFVALGSGKSKRDAKQAAARSALEKLTGRSNTINNIDEQILINMAIPVDDIQKNPISLLQELCTSRRWPPPGYQIEQEEGLPNEKQFTVSCTLFGLKETGRGKSKQLAKGEAASKMWNKLKTWDLQKGAKPLFYAMHETKDSSNMEVTTRRYSYDEESVDPGDGEGWWNYPITPKTGPNPAWHLSTVRQIYQQPRSMLRPKRSPKRTCKKKKKDRDERKKFNKKKRMRRKMRILPRNRKKNKVLEKKGDGSYKGGRGRRPRLHRKFTNETEGEGGNSTEYYDTEENGSGPVADAYIDYDSSYEPPTGGPKKENGEEECEEEESKDGSGDDESELSSDEAEEMSEAYEPSKEKSGDENNSKGKQSGGTKGGKKEKKLKNKETKLNSKRTELNRQLKEVHSKNTKLNTKGNNIRMFEQYKKEIIHLNKNEQKIVDQLKAQQFLNQAKHPNRLSTILLHPIDEDMPEQKGQLKSADKLKVTDSYQINLKDNINNKHEDQLQMKSRNVLRGSISEIANNLLKIHETKKADNEYIVGNRYSVNKNPSLISRPIANQLM